MGQAEPRTRLEQRAQAEHLSIRDFIRRFQDVALECGEQAATVSDSQVKRWFSGRSAVPRSQARRILESWWGESVDRLFGPPDTTQAPLVKSEQELIMSAGRESVEHAIEASSALDPSALEHLHAAARHAARAYYTSAPMDMLIDLVRLRDTVYEQLDRTHKPRQQAELYLLAGQVCGLLSSVSWDLGYPDVAEEQARAAHTYGSVIDHSSLCAWARALQVTGAFWSGHPRQASNIAATALDCAPIGTARARLHAVHARALALIGARDEVVAALDAASDELDQAGDDPFVDEIGGELEFDRSRRALCAGAAFVTLGDGVRAEIEATNALELFALVPSDIRWSAGELGARVDLAAARTLRGDLAGTEDALAEVFTLDPARRTEALGRRLSSLGRILGAARFRGSPESVRIGDAIANFTAPTHSLARAGTRTVIGL
ncbi:hypothetical protein [Actinokineospora sp.]|uniref:hypothetical protein n=1 Tax=Actinokineospora sp. TaxID=1872133 RepID=UPI004037EDE2